MHILFSKMISGKCDIIQYNNLINFTSKFVGLLKMLLRTNSLAFKFFKALLSQDHFQMKKESFTSMIFYYTERGFLAELSVEMGTLSQHCLQLSDNSPWCSPFCCACLSFIITCASSYPQFHGNAQITSLSQFTKS